VSVISAMLGAAQWLVLRHLDGSSTWVWADAFARCGGLAVVTAFTTPLWQPGRPPALIGAAGGLLMAATMAAITGIALVRLRYGR
jgi:hypothetical protein